MGIIEQQLLDKRAHEARLPDLFTEFCQDLVNIKQCDRIPSMNGCRHTAKNQLQSIGHAVTAYLPLT